MIIKFDKKFAKTIGEDNTFLFDYPCGPQDTIFFNRMNSRFYHKYIGTLHYPCYYFISNVYDDIYINYWYFIYLIIKDRLNI